VKKILFYGSIGLGLYLIGTIFKILVYDLSRLTEYGYGYLVGQIILLFLTVVIIYLFRNKKNR
jgi:hypothetical protein